MHVTKVRLEGQEQCEARFIHVTVKATTNKQQIILISWNVLNSCKTFATKTAMWRKKSLCTPIRRKYEPGIMKIYPWYFFIDICLWFHFRIQKGTQHFTMRSAKREMTSYHCYWTTMPTSALQTTMASTLCTMQRCVATPGMCCFVLFNLSCCYYVPQPRPICVILHSCWAQPMSSLLQRRHLDWQATSMSF